MWVLSCAFLVGCGGGAGDGGFKREYRMQVTVGPTTCWGMGAAKFAELARQKTGGRINVKPYYGSQLLKGAQLNSAQMVSLGSIDLALESTINAAPVVPALNVFSLPFLVGSYDELDRLEQGKTGKALFEKMQAKGLMPLAWGENGFRQLTNSRQVVRRPEDMKGLRVRVVGSPIFVETFRALGADPINMNWGDAVTGFQQGTVDGQENPMGILLPVQIWQYHKHVTRWNYLADPLVLYWNKKEWDAFPADIQQALRGAAEEATRYQKALARAGLDGQTSRGILENEYGVTPEIAAPLVHLADRGMTVTELTPAERKAFAARTRAVFDRWAEKIGSEVMALCREDLGRDASP